MARCDECEAIKPPGRSMKAPLGKMMVGAPMDRLGTDDLGPLPETPRGNKYILVVTDYLTKWVEIFAVPNQTAPTGNFRSSAHPSEHPMGVYLEKFPIRSHYRNVNFVLISI